MLGLQVCVAILNIYVKNKKLILTTMEHVLVIPTLGSLMQENLKFEANPGLHSKQQVPDFLRVPWLSWENEVLEG